MKPTLKKRLLDAREACRAIQGSVAGHTFADYGRSLMLRPAVERRFEIIGEALNHAEIEQPELTTSIPDLRRIVGLRNRTHPSLCHPPKPPRVAN